MDESVVFRRLVPYVRSKILYGIDSEHAERTLKITIIFKICHNYYFFNLRFNIIPICALPEKDFIV